MFSKFSATFFKDWDGQYIEFNDDNEKSITFDEYRKMN